MVDKMVGGVRDIVAKGLGTNGGKKMMDDTIKDGINVLDKGSSIVKETVKPEMSSGENATAEPDSSRTVYYDKKTGKQLKQEMKKNEKATN